MVVFSFHLASVPVHVAAAALVRAPRAPGLVHAEVLAGMDLGSPVFSPARARLGRLSVFARWESEEALEAFLVQHPLGTHLAQGWHVRLEYLRRWGCVQAFSDLPATAQPTNPNEPIVAFTLARMRLLQLPRFIRWGRPVEEQVRDHPAVSLALAGMRPPHTVSTFSVWESARAMTGMVFGRDAPREPTGASTHPAGRHHAAMGERERKDFHHEFTTLRFRPLSEHGQFNGRGDYVVRG